MITSELELELELELEDLAPVRTYTYTEYFSQKSPNAYILRYSVSIL